MKEGISQNGPKSERPPFGQNGPINWSKRSYIPKMKVKTAPSQNGPILCFVNALTNRQTTSCLGEGNIWNGKIMYILVNNNETGEYYVM